MLELEPREGDGPAAGGERTGPCGDAGSSRGESLRREPSRAGGRLAHLIGPLLLAVVISALYLGNGETLGSGDTLPARHLPWSLLKDGDFYLDEFSPRYEEGARHAVMQVRGHLVSRYPVGPSLLATPIYLPFVLAGSEGSEELLEVLEKVSAALIVLASAGMMFLTLRLLTSPGVSLGVAAVYALGTSSFSTSSQALWQHGPAQLAIASSLYCLVRGADQRRWLALAGFPMAFAVLCRPADALLVAPLAAWVLVRFPRRFPGLVACGLPVGCFTLWYNLRHFGTALYTQFELASDELWRTPFAEGLAGLLVSPGRGLFVYSPIMVLSIVGFARAWREWQRDDVGLALLRYSSVGVVSVILVHSRWWSWWGGLCYGPRLLADVLPAACMALCAAVGWLSARRWRRLLATALAGWSFAAHFSGAYWDDGRWTGYDLPEGLWSWSDSPLVNPPRELLNTAVIGLRRLPTSRSHPERVACSFPVAGLPSPRAGLVNQQVQVEVRAANTGEAVWLAWPKHARGSVRLSWELRPAGPPAGIERSGKAVMRHDVFPGEDYRFDFPLRLPAVPGEYELRIALLVNQEPRSSRLGDQALVVPVHVRPRRGRAEVDPSPGGLGSGDRG